MKRVVEPELLDELPPEDPRAIHSRRDLRRLNWIMRHVPIFRSALVNDLKQPPRTIAEIGAGDGTLLLKLASQLHERWPGVRVILVDRQRTVSNETLQRFIHFGWRAEIVSADVFDWLERVEHPTDAIIANLFLHHFENDRLSELLRKCAARSQCFAACETRRDRLSLVASRLLGFIGCNSVTRNDARLSVNAGFVSDEISALWPREGWRLMEWRAGLFTHFFAAQRNGGGA